LTNLSEQTKSKFISEADKRKLAVRCNALADDLEPRYIKAMKNKQRNK
jgi:hypothetical protein